MTETPRTDAQKWRYFSDVGAEESMEGVDIEFARQLERELAISQTNLADEKSSNDIADQAVAYWRECAEKAEQALAIVTQDRWNLTEKVIPNLKAAHEQALALRGEPVAKDQEYLAAIIGAFGPGEGVQLDQDTWAKVHASIAKLLAAPISGERVREAQEQMRERCANICRLAAQDLDNEWNRKLGAAKDLSDVALSLAEEISALGGKAMIAETDMRPCK